MTTTALKILAMLTMLIDHIASFIPNTPYYFHWIGRISAPIFMYCCIIGYEKTGNKLKYMFRLYVLNIIMGIINTILNIQYNFVGTILLIIIIIFIIEKFKNKETNAKKILFLFIVEQFVFFLLVILITYLDNSNYDIRLESIHVIKAFFVSVLILDGGLFFVVFGVIMYLFNKSKKSFSFSYIAITISCLLIYNTNILRRVFDIIGRVIDNNYLISVWICEIFFGVDPHFMKTDLLYGDPQWMMIASLPFILMYNGEKGKGLKYPFYIFYPAHIIILYFIGNNLNF